MQKQRNYGIDLLKILSMFMVVVLHVSGQGGIYSNADVGSANFYIAYLLEIACYGAVNLFAITTGYLMQGKQPKYRKLFPMWLQVFLYSVGVTVAVCCVTGVEFPGKLKVSLPVLFSRYWYFTAYFIMFFLIPFFNILIDKISRKQYRILLICLFALMSLSTVTGDPARIEKGYHFVWLSVMYFFGAYLKKYGIPSIITKTVGLLIYGICTIVVWLWTTLFIVDLLNLKNSAIYDYYPFMMAYTSPFIVIAVLGLFCSFAQINIKNKFIAKSVGMLSAWSFGVYLIHTNPAFFKNIIKDAFKGYLNLNPGLLILAVLGTAAAIYIGCTVIDAGRYYLFKLIRVDKWADWFIGKIEKIKLYKKFIDRLEKE